MFIRTQGIYYETKNSSKKSNSTMCLRHELTGRILSEAFSTPLIRQLHMSRRVISFYLIFDFEAN